MQLPPNTNRVNPIRSPELSIPLETTFTMQLANEAFHRDGIPGTIDGRRLRGRQRNIDGCRLHFVGDASGNAEKSLSELAR